MAHHDSGDEVGGARKSSSVAPFAVAFTLGVCVLGIVLAGSMGSFLLFSLALTVFIWPGFYLARPWFVGSERLLAGAAGGFLLNSLAASGLYHWSFLNMGSSAAASVLLTGGLMRVLKGRSVRETKPPRPRRWLVASMALAVALVALPFLRVGESTPEGVAYRAYFSADFMTHLSVVAELQKGSVPPQNPFYSGERLGYYWLFFLFPSLVGQWIGNQEALLLTYLSGIILFSGLAFSAARRVASSPGRAFVAVGAGLMAASYEGLAVLLRFLWLGEPVDGFRSLNVDAFSRWVFELTSLDGLHRSLLYTPQHLFSYSLLLVLMLLILRREPRGLKSCSLAGLLLGGMAGTSIATAMLAGPWLVGIQFARRGGLRFLVRDWVGVGLVSFACLGWYFVLGFFGEAGTALVLRQPRLLEIPAILIFECGALLLLSIPAWACLGSLPFRSLAVMSFLAVLGLGLRGYEDVWMAWRAGSVLLLSLMLLAAHAMNRWSRSAVAWILLPATVTVFMDIYNAQDIGNRSVSAGEFRWTTLVSRAELEALRWLRAETEPTRIVQWDTRAREPGEWALVTAIAERRMAVGFPIFLLEQEKYRRRERRWVRPIFTSGDPLEAHRFSVHAGIDYLLIGRPELEVRGERVRIFWEAPTLFEPVFSNREVSVFRVLR